MLISSQAPVTSVFVLAEVFARDNGIRLGVYDILRMATNPPSA